LLLWLIYFDVTVIIITEGLIHLSRPGEYTAITAAGGFELKDAVALVQKRGRYMREMAPQGTGLMAAILGLDRHAAEKTCLEAAKNGIVAPAIYNSPGQIVIAGEKLPWNSPGLQDKIRKAWPIRVVPGDCKKQFQGA